MSNYDVSYVFKIFDKFSPAIKEMRESLKEFEEGFEHLEKKVKKSDSKLQQFANNINNIGRSLSMKLTAPLIAVGGYAMKNASEFNMMTLSLQAFTGSAESAAKVMEEIKNQSMKTPISTDELTKAATMLLQTGTPVNEVSKRLQQMSIMAIATGQDVVSLTNKLSKFHALGSAPPRSFARIMPALIQEMRSMATQAGLSKQAIDKLFGGGGTKISWELLQKTMDNLTIKGGAFFNVMEAKSNVWESLLIEIHNELRIMAADLGDVILSFFGIDGSLISLRDKIAIVTKKFHEFLEGHKKLVGISLAILAIAAALGPVLIALSAILQIVVLLTLPVSLIVAASVLFMYGIYKAQQQFVLLYNSSILFKKIIDWIVIKVENLYEAIKETVEEIAMFLAHPFSTKVNVEVDKSQLQSQMAGLHSTMTNQIQGGKLSFAPVTHAINSTLDVNLNAPPGTVKNVRAGGDSTVKFNLGQNMTFARGHV